MTQAVSSFKSFLMQGEPSDTGASTVTARTLYAQFKSPHKQIAEDSVVLRMNYTMPHIGKIL